MLMFHETEVKRIGESFRRMKPTLEQIEFKKTRTVSIHDEAFSRLNHLNSLVIVYNWLKTIKRSMFPANKLTDLPDDIFTNMPALRDVLLEKNQLKHFSSAVFERLYDTTLQQVTLSDNPIICDCSVKWYTQKKNRSVRITGNCDIPENLHGCRLIQLSPVAIGILIFRILTTHIRNPTNRISGKVSGSLTWEEPDNTEIGNDDLAHYFIRNDTHVGLPEGNVNRYLRNSTLGNTVMMKSMYRKSVIYNI
ncbi:hypothetical protein CEXT_268261 [Caerostris extrusa]|uniref:Uncharacterized protein n=1 Tax=Caerostris extrusa TaxID=172846 RepID=A0AAV4UZN3_CAEEX|nr:hypothetical protein CEXT_268261 [Caerostris extrusa]